MNEQQKKNIEKKIKNDKRLSFEDGVMLCDCNDLLWLSQLATYRRRQLNSNKVFYNRNFHIEPTNICVNDCVFCSYRRNSGEEGSWEYSIDDIRKLYLTELTAGNNQPKKLSAVTEVHVVGGVHPMRDIYFYSALLSEIKRYLPHVAIKAFTAVEIDYMARKASMPYDRALQLLRESGLDALPGGGAEIFDETVRRQICPSKADAQTWLSIHETAHKIGMRTNATMLFGHIEKHEHRIDHLLRLRELQDVTGGFDAFIPLKYKAQHNKLGIVGEVSTIEVLRTFAVCRLLLDNIRHLKAYWPMLGKDVMQLALLFGTDDIDGTIGNSTKIYSMAGASEQHPVIDVPELEDYITAAGFTPVERDTFYEEIKIN